MVDDVQTLNPPKSNNPPSNIFAKQNISLIIYLFCLFFAPPIIPHVNFILIVFAHSVIMLFLKYRKVAIQIIKQAKMNFFIVGFLVFLLYFFIIAGANIVIGNEVEIKEYIVNFYRFFLIIPVILSCILYIIVRCRELKYSFEDFLFALILAGTLQGILTLIAFAFPEIRQLFIMTMKNNTGEAVFNKPFEVKQRFFGFANDMLDGFGYGVGILAVLPFFLSFYTKKISYLLFAPLLILVPFLNVRTGLVIFVIGFLFSLPILFGMDRKKRKSFFLFFLLLISVTVIMYIVISTYYPATMRWVIRDFVAVFKFILAGENARIGTNSVALWFSGRFFVFPSFPSILFGTGHTVYSVKGFPHSDIGYINDLWLVGVAGCIILYGIYFLLFFCSIHFNRNKSVRYIIVFLITSLLVFQLKGRAFMANLGMILTLLISFYIIFDGYLVESIINNKKDFSNDFLCMINKKKYYDNALVSIVVPVFRVEKYLHRCIDSILAQTYKNLEIILVDDGSPDNCPQICNEYAEKDKRIKVIHQRNSGLSEARNTGIKTAIGQYIAFVDSDDYIDKCYISTLFCALKKYNADISACNYYWVDENTGVIKRALKYHGTLIMTNIEAMKDLFTLPNNSDVVAWNKLYKTSLFLNNHITYPKGKLHEDNFTTYKLYYQAEKIVFINIPCYYYVQRDNSIMSQKFNSRRLDVLDACIEAKIFVKEHGLPLMNEAIFNEFLRILTLINCMVDTKSIDFDSWDKMCSMIIENKRQYMKNPYIKIKQKIALFSINLGRSAYVFIRKVFTLFSN